MDAGTPLMDGSRTGSVTGLTLGTTPAQLYHAVAEGTAMGCRRVVEMLERGGLPLDSFVATGGLASNKFYTQTLANVLQRDIQVCLNLWVDFILFIILTSLLVEEVV